MKNSNDSQNSSQSTAPKDMGFSPWQRLKTKRISYLTLPLLVDGDGDGICHFGDRLEVSADGLFAARHGSYFLWYRSDRRDDSCGRVAQAAAGNLDCFTPGWLKGFMLMFGLPLICVLTFQLVKDMAVYEMGVAMTPASQMLEKAATEEIKIAHLNGELAAIEGKKTERERKLAELAAKRNKAKADLEESLKRNDEARQDAISLTEYQKKELSEVQARQTAIIQQFNSDTEQLTKTIADLRARRETELGRATKWNAEEARIENAYKTKLAEYTNKKAAYDKAKAEYDGANFVRRQLMKEPVEPRRPARARIQCSA